jgi:hypothetical protein
VSRSLLAVSESGGWSFPGLLGELQSQGLIDAGAAGVSVLGVSQARLLDHAADIFESHDPDGLERAAIDLAEPPASAIPNWSAMQNGPGCTGAKVTEIDMKHLSYI